ncbi:hypothetical protein CO683_36495 [Bradyrhizobium ottawaense]|uniref:hypothetical protein n=1 Tax=Bradyrhizobium ottawaense TaxID=931866 RepID=UPI000BE9CE08|nr:hypothetical protein [Bradyrhizobium ottawaense]PDT64760.1 hypothetical protein CO683_36495 [Bradyrhizobium ottawaense]
MQAMSLQINLGDTGVLILDEQSTSIVIVSAVGIAVLLILILTRVQRTKARLLLVALVLITVPILALCIPASWYVVRSMFIPAKAAEIALPDLEATLGLEFYLHWSTDSGRYLIIRNSAGAVRQHMSAFDWAHWPRTSVYLINDGRVAVLGPTYDDYIVDPKRRTFETLWNGTPSDTWTYFGAFDFRNEKLVFIPASNSASARLHGA